MTKLSLAITSPKETQGVTTRTDKASLIEISEELLKVDSNDPSVVLGYPDDIKLKSSMTLFYLTSEEIIFKKVLDKFFCGELDKRTVDILKKM